jgi:GNAT superfamily N-acetyltransferase
MSPKIDLRPVLASDEPFLFDLFRSLRSPRFEFQPPGHPQMASSIRLQFQAREHALASNYPGCDDHLICVDETPVGRFCIARDTAGIHVADLAIAPERQRNGIATAVMQALIAEAEQSRLPMTVAVAQTDAASFRFFRKLGFEVDEQNVSFAYLKRRPEIKL